MTETLNASVLRRKLAPRAAPAPGDAGAGGDAARALVRTFARAVSDCAPLMAEGGTRSTRILSLAELIDSIEPDAFVGILSGDDAPPGLAIIDQTGFAALVEAMTIGRLAAREPASRRATSTDAALLGEVLNTALAGLDADDPARGRAMHRPVPDNRLLPVLLDDLPYGIVTLEMTLSSGDVRRPAQVILALPRVASPEPGANPAAATMAAGASAPGEDWARALEASVMTAPAAMQAELGRITLPLAEVLALETGSALTLPLSNLEEVRLVALDGTIHAMGRLGQSRGMRAIRLTSWPGGTPPDTSLFEQARPSSEPTAPPAKLVTVPDGRAPDFPFPATTDPPKPDGV